MQRDPDLSRYAHVTIGKKKRKSRSSFALGCGFAGPASSLIVAKNRRIVIAYNYRNTLERFIISDGTCCFFFLSFSFFLFFCFQYSDLHYFTLYDILYMHVLCIFFLTLYVYYFLQYLSNFTSFFYNYYYCFIFFRACLFLLSNVL